MCKVHMKNGLTLTIQYILHKESGKELSILPIHFWAVIRYNMCS